MAKGAKTGGRVKGSANKSTRERLQALMDSGETPLEYMLRIMRDKMVDDERRDKMALAAASYMHPRLASTEISGNPDKPLEHKVAIVFRSAGQPE